RCSTCSLTPTIGVSCRSSTPRIWCSARQPSSNPSINSFPGRPSSLSKPNTSPPSSATGSLPNSLKRSAVNAQRVPRVSASGIVSANPQSRPMTNSASSCVCRPPPTTSPLSSTTARWNIGRARQPAPSPPSERRSTASSTCAKSCSVAIAVISNTSPVWTISRPASARSTGSPNRVPSKGAISTASIFSAASNRACSRLCSVPASTSPACAAPTSGRCSANALPPPSPDNSSVYAYSASSNASLAPTATTSPALAAPLLLLVAASPNKPLFLLSPDKSAHKLQTLRS